MRASFVLPTRQSPARVGRSVALAPANAGSAGLGRFGGRATYLRLLTWAFTLFNSVRMFAYAPTIWAICSGGDSSQHSLWTWCTWLGANATMAAWLLEQNEGRVNKAVIVNIGNAAMCLTTVAVIVACRL